MVIENGDGLENADSYISTTDADTYFSARGNTKWTALSDANKEIFLIKATDYVDNVFKWKGKKKTQEQALNFPRVKLFDENGYEITGIPNVLKYAVCECANLVSTGVEMFATKESNGLVTSERIGQLAFTYDVSKAVKDSTLYDSINLRLRGLYIESGDSVKIGKVTK